MGAAGADDGVKLVLAEYEKRIEYYWKASGHNKRTYTTTRYLLIILGALVTLLSSLSSAGFDRGWFGVALKILTPVLAATMAVAGGMSQEFQWGAAWSDGVITATRLQKERDRISVTPVDQIDPVKEMAMLDDMVLAETQGFFQRLFGSGGPRKADPKAGG